MTPQAAPRPGLRFPAEAIGHTVRMRRTLGPGLRGAELESAGRGGVFVARGGVRRRRTKLRPAPWADDVRPRRDARWRTDRPRRFPTPPSGVGEPRS